MSYEQTKKIATRFLNKVYIHEKILGARALARAAHLRARRTCARGARQPSYCCKNFKIIKFEHMEQNILLVRARKCTRAKSFFRIKKFITFPTFYIPWMFIPLKLMVLQLFQTRDFLGKKGITAPKNNIHPLTKAVYTSWSNIFI